MPHFLYIFCASTEERVPFIEYQVNLSGGTLQFPPRTPAIYNFNSAYEDDSDLRYRYEK